MSAPVADKLRVYYVCDDHTSAELEQFAIMNFAANLLDAIDALPDTVDPNDVGSVAFAGGYAYAMRQVKALLLTEGGPS